MVTKRNGSQEEFDRSKIENAILKAFMSAKDKYGNLEYPVINKELRRKISKLASYVDEGNSHTVEDIQNEVENILMMNGFYSVAKTYILYREQHSRVRDFVENKKKFIERYKGSVNTANATIDDNANVNGKNIGIMNAEIHKEDNIHISRKMIMDKLRELYPDFDCKNYVKDLESHIIYKHDESSFAGPIAPYCCSITMYPFLTDGIKNIGGLSAAPKNLDSFCGMYVNLIFATSAMFAGAIATSEFLLYFDYFCRKEWGPSYHEKKDVVISNEHCMRKKTIQSQIHQYFQQVIYSINQPTAARGLQSAFVNFSIFDKPFYDGMFGNFMFPDETKPQWESFNWLQREFLHWFNQERLRAIITFPVVSCTLVYQNGEFLDKDFANFVAQEYSEGNSFFTYISDTVDSLSSCCRLKNKIQTKEFNFTNGNMGIMTGSKSVITLNLNRIIQDCMKKYDISTVELEDETIRRSAYGFIKDYLTEILERVYKYHTAYNESLWDMYNAGLLPVYRSGFINLNRQYLTIGINGLNEAAEFLDLRCTDNEGYSKFCQLIFSTIKEQNILHKTKKTTYNTECVPAESLAAKNYNWDKADGYKVPEDRNLYASYIYIPSDKSIGVMERIRMHGANYIGDYLDGGSSAHINLDSHLSKAQYDKILKYAAEVGCQYFTFNVPNCECEECGFIAKQPFEKCPRCGSTKVSLWDRIIGYLTKIKNWSAPRQIEQKTRDYAKIY